MYLYDNTLLTLLILRLDMSNNIRTVKVIKKQVPSDVKNKLSKLFFYLQDISCEIQSSYGILQIVESTLDDSIPRETVTFNDFKHSYTFQILNKNNEVVKTMAKIALQTTILGICKILEVIRNPDLKILLDKYCPNSYKRLDTIINQRYSNHMRDYRNKYVAHPLDKKNNDFLSLTQIHALLAKILEISDFKDVKFIEIFNLVSALHHPDLEDPDLSISWAIYHMSSELKINGINPNIVMRG